ncbi:Uncharacterised protein [Mycoplasmopsis citelli]|uniref:Lipoprotein n=1 Tax=Mycoplasmopsis citelli TaxID=171281 RepID=A0A449B370_9BACT|nr:hypothetical protein [Mycoplasmopsis citelli]VEU75047.1 Uncharacterised protein [Mycoplasmopsis citelli]
MNIRRNKLLRNLLILSSPVALVVTSASCENIKSMNPDKNNNINNHQSIHDSQGDLSLNTRSSSSDPQKNKSDSTPSPSTTTGTSQKDDLQKQKPNDNESSKEDKTTGTMSDKLGSESTKTTPSVSENNSGSDSTLSTAKNEDKSSKANQNINYEIVLQSSVEDLKKFLEDNQGQEPNKKLPITKVQNYVSFNDPKNKNTGDLGFGFAGYNKNDENKIFVLKKGYAQKVSLDEGKYIKAEYNLDTGILTLHVNLNDDTAEKLTLNLNDKTIFATKETKLPESKSKKEDKNSKQTSLQKSESTTKVNDSKSQSTRKTNKEKTSNKNDGQNPNETVSKESKKKQEPDNTSHKTEQNANEKLNNETKPSESHLQSDAPQDNSETSSEGQPPSKTSLTETSQENASQRQEENKEGSKSTNSQLDSPTKNHKSEELNTEHPQSDQAHSQTTDNKATSSETISKKNKESDSIPGEQHSDDAKQTPLNKQSGHDGEQASNSQNSSEQTNSSKAQPTEAQKRDSATLQNDKYEIVSKSTVAELKSFLEKNQGSGKNKKLPIVKMQNYISWNNPQNNKGGDLGFGFARYDKKDEKNKIFILKKAYADKIKLTDSKYIPANYDLTTGILILTVTLKDGGTETLTLNLNTQK